MFSIIQIIATVHPPKKTLGIWFDSSHNKTNNTEFTKSNYSEYLPARIMFLPFFYQYLTEDHNSSLKFSETESSVNFESPVPLLELFTSF